MNATIINTFTKEELHKVAQAMAQVKALGLHGIVIELYIIF
jgi:hypothetical protein